MELKETYLEEKLNHFFGFNKFKGDQETIIKSIMDGIDTFVIMPTGGGKSMCYQLPALLSEGTTIVISPLIALMKNQVDAIRGYSQNDNIAHFLNSTLNKTQTLKVREDVTSGATKLLYIAPETLTKEENIEFFKSITVSFIAVDEAHCISEWGHDFRPEYRRIREMIDYIEPSIPIITLTATATPKVRSDIVKNLRLKNHNYFISSFNRDNLYYEVRPKTKKENTFKQIIQICHKLRNKSGIIYVQSRKSTEEIASMLSVNGIRALPYHAGLDQKTRAKNQDSFLMQGVEVIVATIAFGMGIDKPDVRFVIHYDIPKSIENYYQETGRAGRDGLDGICVSFYAYKDILRLEKFMRDKPAAERDMGAQLLNEVVAYTEVSTCRRQFLLHYFDEHFEAESCNKMCDNCKHPKEFIEAGDEFLIALKVVVQLHEKYRLDSLVDFVMGNATQEMKDYKTTKLPLFGSGKGHDALFWNSVFRQGLLNDYIVKDIIQYGLIRMTDKGHEFIKKPQKIKIPINHDYIVEGNDYIVASNVTAALDNTLLSLLTSLRKKVAVQKDIPPYIIFQDPSLADMATQYPLSMEDMTKISGVSMGKAQKYALPFINLIAKYVEENEIDRPTDIVIKKMAQKSKNKVHIILGIDKKTSLEEVADNLKLTMEDLLYELDSIVSSGTKVNIDYYLNENVDEYVQEDIIEYFMESEDADVDKAFTELKDDDISLEEIQLVKVKFISDNAN